MKNMEQLIVDTTGPKCYLVSLLEATSLKRTGKRYMMVARFFFTKRGIYIYHNFLFRRKRL